MSHVSRHSPLPSPARRVPRRIVNRSLFRKDAQKVRASAYGLPRREKKRTTRASGLRRSTTCIAERYFPHADAPGLAHVRRGFFVVLLTSQKVSVSPQVKGPPIRPRLRMHGRLTHRRTHSDWLPNRRHRYRRSVFHEDTVTARFVRLRGRLRPLQRA